MTKVKLKGLLDELIIVGLIVEAEICKVEEDEYSSKIKKISLTLIAEVLAENLKILHPVKAVAGVVRLQRQPLRPGHYLKDKCRGEGERVRRQV